MRRSINGYLVPQSTPCASVLVHGGHTAGPRIDRIHNEELHRARSPAAGPLAAEAANSSRAQRTVLASPSSNGVRGTQPRTDLARPMSARTERCSPGRAGL